MDIEELQRRADDLREQIGRVVIGQDDVVLQMVVALLADGHVLLEGMPGTAKTLLAHVFARSLDLEFKRIQFTPDLMPGDVTGTNLFDFHANTFRLTRGPVFTDVLLADEINRSPPKTQAALLQAMQERQVTIDGTTHELGSAFLVLATQNPIEHEGTYPLPEAQLDRFLLKVRVGYPSRDSELTMARRHGHRAGMPDLDELEVVPLADREWVGAARRFVAAVELADEVLTYVVDLVRATRQHPALAVGASPRSINMLCLCARALAAVRGRGYVLPDDVKELTGPVLGHRIVLAPGAELEGGNAVTVLQQIVDQLPVPR